MFQLMHNQSLLTIVPSSKKGLYTYATQYTIYISQFLPNLKFKHTITNRFTLQVFMEVFRELINIAISICVLGFIWINDVTVIIELKLKWYLLMPCNGQDFIHLNFLQFKALKYLSVFIIFCAETEIVDCVLIK